MRGAPTGHHAGHHRQEGQPLHVEDRRRCSARPTRPSPSRRPASRPSSRGSRWIRTPARSRCTTSSSCRTSGKAINPLGVEGQMQGGAVQCLGMALTEGLLFDDSGRLTNPSLLDYRKLTAADLPNHRDHHRRGARARRSLRRPRRRRAAHHPRARRDRERHPDATGVRLTELPLSPERIALAIPLVNGKPTRGPTDQPGHRRAVAGSPRPTPRRRPRRCGRAPGVRLRPVAEDERRASAAESSGKLADLIEHNLDELAAARDARQRQADLRVAAGRHPARGRRASATTRAGPTRSTARPSPSRGNAFTYTLRAAGRRRRRRSCPGTSRS